MSHCAENTTVWLSAAAAVSLATGGQTERKAIAPLAVGDASMAEVADAYTFSKDLLRGNSPSLPLTQALSRREPDSIFLVESHDTDQPKIVGIVIAAPTKRRAVTRVMQKETVSLKPT